MEADRRPMVTIIWLELIVLELPLQLLYTVNLDKDRP